MGLKGVVLICLRGGGGRESDSKGESERENEGRQRNERGDMQIIFGW